MKKVVLFSAILMSLSIPLLPVKAEASDLVQNSTVEAEIKGGGFKIQVPSIKGFGNLVLAPSNTKYSTGFNSEVVVEDLRGVKDNWQLSVSSTSFSTTGSKEQYKNILSIMPANSLKRVGNVSINTMPDIKINKETVLDDGDVLIAKSLNGSGAGKFTLDFPTNALNLIVGPNMQDSRYSSTLTWNLMSVPR